MNIIVARLIGISQTGNNYVHSSEWPTILRRVEQNNEPLRQVALDYEVSYETIRRIVQAVRKQQRTGEEIS